MNRSQTIALTAFVFALIAPGASAGAGSSSKAPAPRGKAARGTSHKAPEGWSVRAPKGWKLKDMGTYLLLGHDTEAGAILVYHMADAAAPSEILVGASAYLSQQIGGQIDFGAAAKKGARFAAEGRATAMDGSRVWGRLVGFQAKGRTLLVFGMTADDDDKLANLRKRVDEVALSAAIFTPKPTGGKVAGIYQYEGPAVSARMDLCGDGSYYYESIVSINVKDGSGNTTSSAGGTKQQRGRWTSTGTASSGTISVAYNDGSTERFSYQRVVGGLSIGGRDYLRTRDCN